MAYIQTTTRLIKVKESWNELFKAMDTPFLFQVTEDASFFGELSNKTHEQEKIIYIHINHVVEVHP